LVILYNFDQPVTFLYRDFNMNPVHSSNQSYVEEDPQLYFADDDFVLIDGQLVSKDDLIIQQTSH